MAVLTRSRRAALAAAGLFLSSLGLGPMAGSVAAESGAPIASTEAVYAAFTINLTRFISWPAPALGSAGTPLIIGTFARDPINAELDVAIKGEEVDGHPLQTVRLHSLNDLPKCHVVFVSRGVADPAAVLTRLERRPVLTISDADGFLTLGGHVRFVPQASNTRLQISAANLRACGLEARSQLLRIAAAP